MGRTASAGEALTLFTHTALSGSGEIDPTRVTPCRRQVEYDENCLDDTVRLSMPFASTGRGDPLHEQGPQAECNIETGQAQGPVRDTGAGDTSSTGERSHTKNDPQ